jgi:exopolysaccharide production protein ExoQ
MSALPHPAQGGFKVKWEYIFSVVSLMVLAGAFNPFFYDLLGSKSADYSDVNPLRLVVTTATYLLALALVLYRGAYSRRILASNLFLVAMFLLPMVSILWSVEPAATFRRAAAYALTGAFVLYLVSAMSPEELLRRLVMGLFIGGVASLFYVVIFPKYGIHTGAALGGSWKGIYGHKNELGRVASIAIISAGFMTPLTKRQNQIRVATIAIYLFLLAMAQSKTNYLIVASMAGIIPMMGWLRNKRVSPGLRLTLFLLAGAVLVLAITYGSDAILASIGRDATFSGRKTLWRGVSAIIAEKYPVLGAGYGAFFTTAGAIWDLSPYLKYWEGIPNHAHSGFLNTRANLGIPGVVMLTVFIVLTAKQLIQRLMSDPDRKVWAGFFALFFLFLVNNFSESVAFKHSDIAWVIVALAYAYTSPLRASAVVPARRAPPALVTSPRRP